MPKSSEPSATFNLWSEPWIALERPDGGLDRHGIEQTLLQAHEYKFIYEPSPLAIVGIHRLLTAILQFALNPQRNADPERLWRAGRFPPDKVKSFGEQYAHRFDLFSDDEPFLQSADLPLTPKKGDKFKSVAYLTPDIPAGTAVTHYRHGAEDEQVFCPACAGAGLVCVPPFAAAGGQGIKPSINGVPPIYVLPGGQSLFESLAASLLTPDHQPGTASKKKDDAWWVRTPKVKSKHELREVGYLHSLTFPARRVRLHPERVDTACTRCGLAGEWGVRTMVFEMGESRPKTAEFWLDPFAAYRLPGGKSKRAVPTPIRPTPGRAVWREYAGLFLTEPDSSQASRERTVRPAVLEQINALRVEGAPEYFRCIGMRTDMKAKVFEWLDTGFDVPPALLRDETAGLVVGDAIRFADDCGRIITGYFQKYFGRASKSKKSERHASLKARMAGGYWAALAAPFRQLVLALPAGRSTACRAWAEAVFAEAKSAFERAADSTGDNADDLRQSESAKKWCAIQLAQKRKEYLDANP